MNYLQRENLRLYLEWKRKFMLGFVEMDPWPAGWRQIFEQGMAMKMHYARHWLAGNRVLSERRKLRLVRLHTHTGPVLSDREANELITRVTKGA